MRQEKTVKKVEDRRRCSKCKKIKLIDKFYKRKYYGWCKACEGELLKRYRKTEKGRKWHSAYRKKRYQLECTKKCIKPKKPKKVRPLEYYRKLKTKINKIYRLKYPLINKAHRILCNHVRIGDIRKYKRCQICNNKTSLHGHHEDYNKPLEVYWLCQKCHRQIHIERRIYDRKRNG